MRLLQSELKSDSAWYYWFGIILSFLLTCLVTWVFLLKLIGATMGKLSKNAKKLIIIPFI